MINLKKIAAIGVGGLIVVANVIGGVMINNNVNDNSEALKIISEQTKEDEVVVTPAVVPTQLDEVQAEVDLIKLKMFEEDAFEAESEILAIEEIEDDDYEALFDFMTDPAELNLFIDSAKDIEEVIIEDVDVSVNSLEDKDSKVTHELKVYYENSDGDRKKVYLTVDSEIEDGEVEDLDIIETA